MRTARKVRENQFHFGGSADNSNGVDTEHPHTDARNLAPELTLIATLDDGMPASEQ